MMFTIEGSLIRRALAALHQVIVTVSWDDQPGLELEIPAETPAGDLARRLSEIFLGGESVQAELEAFPPGRRLRPDETPMSAGVGDGAWIVLHRNR